MNPTLLIWIALVALLASLIFSVLSYALRKLSRVQLDEQLVRYNRAHALDAILAAQYDLALSSATFRLVANAAVIIALAMYFQIKFADSPHPFKVFGLTLLLAVPALLIASVAIPQAWAKYAGENFIAFCWPMLRVALWLTWPVVRVLNVFDELVKRLAGVTLTEDADTDAEKAEQELLHVVAEGTAEGTVDEEQRKMIEGIISFRDLQVGQIMTPRTEIIAVDVRASLGEVRERIIKDGLSRIPVYENSLDNVIGILYAKDLLAMLGTLTPSPTDNLGNWQLTAPTLDLRSIVRPALFVPKTKPLRDLLREFKLQHVHMAVVLDEYGGTNGLVTSEDIIEEIVGDIADEYERPAPDGIKRVSELAVEVDARTNITDLNRTLDLALPEEGDYQTVGGFVLATLGLIPIKGTTLTHEGLTFTVLEADPRRIKKLRLDLPEPNQPIEENSQPAHAA